MARTLAVLFVAAVIVPGILLGIIAMRAIDREEAYVEKRLQQTLLAEVDHTITLINGRLDAAVKELGGSLVLSAGADPRRAVEEWKKTSDLVEVPFLLSPTRELLLPAPGGKMTPGERLFVEAHRGFFGDAERIPVYQNVAVAYGGDAAGPASSSAGRNESYKAQQAIAKFRQSEDVRSQVYDEARRKGGRVASRNVALQQNAGEEESIFVAEEAKFSDITRKGGSGLVPRFAGGKLTLLFWKKDAATGLTAGCLVRGEALRDRILAALPEIYSSARILTVLDEGGRPLLAPEGGKGRDWRKPFAAAEISELLPRWEVAAYLTDPGAVSARAQVTAALMGALILLLFASLTVGGALVLRAMRSELILAEQKTGFVTNVSHELKTPLTSIRMFAEMLREKRQPDEEKRERYLEIMVSETERLTRLIDNVLDFSKMRQGRRQYLRKKLDIVELCGAVLESQRARLEHKGFAVSFKPLVESLAVCADAEALRQVLVNLLANAEKYSDERREIELEVARERTHGLVKVADRGIGVSPADAKKIFKEFYRVDSSLTSKAAGTGLGLTIARSIVRDHGGDLHCLPRSGGGSTFQFTLPIEVQG